MRLIDADALMEKLCDSLKDGETLYRIPPCAIDDAPTIEAEPVKHGRWEYIPTSEERWRCSECKTEYLIPVGCHPATDCGMLYCDHCGAKMDGGNNNE